MFKKTRRKIVAAIMAVLVLLWVGTLAVIYATSYYEMSHQNREMLQAHADMYVIENGLESLPASRPKPDGGRPGFSDSPVFQLSTFYTVALSYDGTVLDLQNDRPAVHSDSELSELAAKIAAGTKESGTENNLLFCRVDKGGYTLVAFMDNTILNENAAMLLRYTLIFGACALVVFFFLAVFLAKKIVKPLEQSHQKQKQFVSDAGHELKTPVSVVSANAELLARQIGENQWLSNIQYENERMGVLVTQLLELARTETVTPQLAHVDFSRLVQGEVLPFESIAFEKGLEILCEITPGVAVMGDPTALKQVVSVLMDNAMSHSKGKTVRLTLTGSHGWADLSVINQGDPIPEAQRSQIFERFYRLDDARTRDGDHYGLGLAIAKTTVTAHKGTISVQCYDGLVEFRVAIPLA